jgi:hypothetical protein
MLPAIVGLVIQISLVVALVVSGFFKWHPTGGEELFLPQGPFILAFLALLLAAGWAAILAGVKVCRFKQSDRD